MAPSIRLALIVAAVVAAPSSWAMNGKDWDSLSEPMQATYVRGVIDAWRNYASIEEEYPAKPQTTAGMTLMRAFECLDGDLSNGQVRALVAKWLANHPEQSHASMASIVWTAVTETCRKAR